MPRSSPALVITPGTPCGVCGHPRSSHSMVIVTGQCHVDKCDCGQFEPVCGCGHLYSWHLWSVDPDPWGCDRCSCTGFGAAQEESQTFQQALFDMTR